MDRFLLEMVLNKLHQLDAIQGDLQDIKKDVEGIKYRMNAKMHHLYHEKPKQQYHSKARNPHDIVSGSSNSYSRISPLTI